MLGKAFKKGMQLSLALMMCMTGITLDTYAADSQITDISAKGLSIQDHSADLVVDGKYDTYWETPTPSQSVNSYKRNVDLDLHGLYDVSGIKVFTDTDKYYQYSIYASVDGVTYDKIAYKADQIPGTADGEEYKVGAQARYLRINVNFMSGSKRAVNLREVEVYGSLISKEEPESQQIETDNFEDSTWGKEYEKFETDEAYANQKTIDEVYNLIGRVIGDEWRDSFLFELRPNSEDGHDIFEVESKDGKILVRGNDGVSLAAGLNYYLKTYCKIDYNPLFSSNLVMPKTLPMMEEKVVKETMYDLRYALNFCTYSYTMSFWNWDEYEAFIDWAAMNGVNLMLDIVGQEEVQRRFLREYGYSDEEIKDYITGPAYFAWFYMQNMTGYGGPLPDNWFADRVELGRKMHDRMQAFGITPVMEGYAGMVPQDFGTKNPKAKMIPAGSWSGYTRPATVQTFLTDSDVANGKEDYYGITADTFYQVQKDVYGEISKYYAVDLFHEGGNAGDIANQMTKIYSTVQARMMANDEDAVWIMQKWGSNANQTQLKDLDKEHVIVLDLFSEQTPKPQDMEDTGTPWIWNMLHNFGGRMGMFGNPELLATKIPDDMKKYDGMVGIGITPEALNTSPAMWELLFDMTWEQDPINYREWISNYIERRYGKTNEDVEQAWEILLDTVYQNNIPSTQGAAESVVNWKPSMGKYNAASTYGHSQTNYDNEEFEKAVSYLIKAYPEFKDSATFKYDFIDVLSQVVSNSGKQLHAAMASAYENKNIEEFDRLSAHFLEMIKLEDQILSTNKEYSVGSWINKSRKMVTDADDWTKDLFELNARSLVTVWGSANNDSLLDYSNRQWSGLTSDVYYKRWETAIQEFRNRIISDNVSNKNVDSNAYWMMVWEWANQKSDEADHAYSEEATSLDLANLAEEVVENYTIGNLKTIIKDGAVTSTPNIALGKTVTSNKPTASDSALSNLTDANLQSDWVQANAEWPTELTVDLNGTYDLERVGFKLPQVADDFTIGYKIYVYQNGSWTTEPIAQQDPKAINGTIEVDYTGTASKIKYVFDASGTTATKAPAFAELEAFGSPAENELENVALHKPVSVEGFNCAKANFATDGIYDNVAPGSTSTTKGAFIVDLEETYEASNVNIYMEPGKDFGFKFKTFVQLEDDKWIEIDDQSTNTLTTSQKREFRTELDPVNIKKVKVEYYGKTDGTEMWPGVAEIEVLGKSVTLENIALGKTIILGDGLSKGNEGKAVDGNRDTIYGSANSVSQSDITLDLGDAYQARNINIVMEKNLTFGFKFKTFVQLEDDSWEMVDDQSNNTLPTKDQREFPVKLANNMKIKKVKVEYYGKTNGSEMWPGIAEIEVMAEEKKNEEVEEANASRQNIAYKAGTTVTKESGSTPGKNLTDNDITTLWTTGDNTYPAIAEVDLGTESFVEYTRVNFEIANDSPNGRAFTFIVRLYDGDHTLVLEDDQTGTSEKIPYHDTIVNDKIRYIEVELTGKLSIEGAWPALSEIQAMAPLTNALEDASVTPVEGLDASKIIDDEDTTGVNITKANTVFEFTLENPKDIYAVEFVKSSDDALLYKIEVQEPESTDWVVFEETTKSKDTRNKIVVEKNSVLASKIRVTILNEQMDLREVRVYMYRYTPELLGMISDIEAKVNAKTIGALSGNYTQESKDQFMKEITAIKDEIANIGEINSNEVAPFMKRVNDAYKTFIKDGFVSISRSPIIAAIEQANALKVYVSENGKESLLTEDFTTAFEAAKAAKTANISQKEINVAAQALTQVTETITNMLSVVEQYELTLAQAKDVLERTTIGDQEGNVPQSAYNTFKKAIADVEIAFKEDASKAGEYITTLKTAMETLEDAKIKLNTTALEAVIQSVEEYDATLYTKDSWEEVQSVLAEANKVLNATDKTQKTIDDACTALSDALENLVKLEKDALKQVIAKAQELKERDYTADSWKVLTDALEAANEVLENPSLNQSDLDDAVTALKEAIASLIEIETVNTSSLQTLYNLHKEKQQGDYTDETWKVFVTALQNAEDVLSNQDITQKEVDDAFAALESAVEGLKKNEVAIDKTKLAQALNDYATILEDGEKYTEDSFKAFTKAYAAAKAVNEKEDATQAEIDQAVTVLQAAQKALTMKPTEPEDPDTPDDPSGNIILENDMLGHSVIGPFEKEDTFVVDPVEKDGLQNILDTIVNPEVMQGYTLQQVFDMYILRNGQQIDWKDKEVTVRLKLDPTLLGKPLEIIYISDEGNVEFIPSQVKDGVIEFKTTHFSNYAIVTKTTEQKPVPEDPTQPDPSNPQPETPNTDTETSVPNTGDSTATGAYAISLLFAAGAILCIYKKRREAQDKK